MKKLFFLSVSLFLCMSAMLFFSSCSKDEDWKEEACEFLYGKWKWEGGLYELTFQPGGKVLWHYNDDRGTKETTYTYDKETSIISFTQYHEDYKVLKMEPERLFILSLWDDKKNVWIKE